MNVVFACLLSDFNASRDWSRSRGYKECLSFAARKKAQFDRWSTV